MDISSMHGASKAGAASLQEQRLQFEQFRLVVRNITPTTFAMPLFAVVIALMLSQWVPAWKLIAWVASVAVLCAGMGVLYFAWHRSAQQLQGHRNWFLMMALAASVFSVVWIAPSFIFWDDCGDLGRLLLTLVFACCVAGCAALQSPCPPLLVANAVPYVLALCVPPLLEGTPFYFGLSALGAGFSLVMGQLARQIYLTSRDMLLLREDKNDLIEQLTAAKIESDRARRRAEAASQAKSEFLANMSHELRTPLNAILGFSEIMKDETFGRLGSPQYLQYAAHIHGSGRHLLGLINDVLDLARIEAGRFQVHAVEIDPAAEVASALALFEVRAKDGAVVLAQDIEPGLPCLLADERALRQILLNLLSNAVKFTGRGGTVTVFARRGQGGGMDLGVRDTGVGIDPADLDAALEAFGQGHHQIAVAEKGTGLGLPIVRGLMEAHSGRVRLESELGKGTTVTCSFPRERLVAPHPVPVRLATVL